MFVCMFVCMFVGIYCMYVCMTWVAVLGSKYLLASMAVYDSVFIPARHANSIINIPITAIIKTKVNL